MTPAALPLPDSALVLSPMVDVTDGAFRAIARQWGADVTCSEMVSAAALAHGNPHAHALARRWPGESPYGVQVMTGDPREAAAAVATLAAGPDKPPDFIDINLGCPAPNILRSCAGGFLLRDPARAEAVMRSTRQAADNAGIAHVSAKLRTGPTHARPTFMEVGKAAQDAGLAWVTLHGRSVEQGYSGQADWDAIALLVKALDIPVVGNGDLRLPQDVVAMRQKTGCHGFFIARAAMHDPTVFRRMRAALQGRPLPPPPTLEQRIALARNYLHMAPLAGTQHVAALRRQVARFMAGAPGAKRLRVAMHQANDAKALDRLLESALELSRSSAAAPQGR